MPTYCYRCQHCQREQTLSHGMLESQTPVCEDCGHFCRKVIQSAPPVLPAMPPIALQEPLAPPHDCGSACALHRIYSSQNKKPESAG
ncbi:zinc ribbon domain-containing protein [Vampirovibrio sp.]|uniref:zinc ribbon domain-containing protein n=1 Tax=Vampirovibrio sp. TaxID=2717857 RepID=UPI003593F293